MKKRVLTAVIGVPVLLAVLLWVPLWISGVAFGLLCAVACYELMHMTGKVTRRRIYVSGMVCAFVLPLISSFEAHLGWSVGVLLLLFFILSIEQMATFPSENHITLEVIAITMMAGGLLPLMLATLLRIGQIPAVGRVRMLVPFVIAFSSDTGAFFTGRALGKHKLAPRISPKKTLEGALGGLLSATLMSALYGLLLQALGYGVNLLALAGFGAVGAVVSQLGDLTFSAFKRQYGIKDYGNILPGHGGVLDRFDSLYYLTPLAEVWMFTFHVIWP